MKTETILLAAVVLGGIYFITQARRPAQSDADLVRAGADIQRKASERSFGEQLGGLGEDLVGKIFG